MILIVGFVKTVVAFRERDVMGGRGTERARKEKGVGGIEEKDIIGDGEVVGMRGAVVMVKSSIKKSLSTLASADSRIC